MAKRRMSAALLGCFIGLFGLLALLPPAAGNSSGLRVRALDPMARPDTFRIVVEADPRTDAQIGTIASAASFGVELADGEAEVLKVHRLGDLKGGTHTTVAIDHSLSFRKFAPATDAILTHLAGRMLPQDSMSLLLFGYEKTEFPVRKEGADFVADVAASSSVGWDRHTRLLAHLEDAVRHAGKQNPDGIRQVLLVTDGDEESGAYDKQQIIGLARSLGVRVQTFIFKPSQALGKGKLTGIDNLRVVSRQTGGDPFEYSASTVSDSATAAAVAELDAWVDGTRRMLAVDVTFRCLSRASLENTLRVETPPGSARTAWSENHTFTESPGTAMYAPCEEPADSPAAAAPAPVVPSSSAPARAELPAWLLPVVGVAAGLLLLLLLIALLRVSREESPSPPARPIDPMQIPSPSSLVPSPPGEAPTPEGAPPAPAEALPDLPEIHLRVISGEYRGKKYRLFKKTVQMGGDATLPGNDHVFDVTTVSGRHAEFHTFPSGDLWVTDLDSSNGTFVNGQRLAAGDKLGLAPGDLVGLGPDLLLVVERPGDAPASSQVPVAPDPEQDSVVDADDSRLVASGGAGPELGPKPGSHRPNRAKTIIE